MRYLDALAHVADPTLAVRSLDAITTRKRTDSGRTLKPFSPLSRPDHELFEALLRGEHTLRGFTNRDPPASRHDGAPADPPTPSLRTAWRSAT